MNKLFLIFHTIRYLRPIQIRYQLWYRVRRAWRKFSGFTYPLSYPQEGSPLQFTPWIDKTTSYRNGTYIFLNQSETNSPFGGKIRGALWRYNLYYMDYLLQPGMDKETGLQLIEGFIQKLSVTPEALEPYPIALRGINWIKFLSQVEERNTPSFDLDSKNESTGLNSPPTGRGKTDEGISKKSPESVRGLEQNRIIKHIERQPPRIANINASLYAQYHILLDNLEYHLMGNHLLEDGFSLLFGAFYFKDQMLYDYAGKILHRELKEQVLADGAHFELSPMYHQILLDRLLDCINLLQNNPFFSDQYSLLEKMQSIAEKMLGWLDAITFSNGEIPLLNDTAPGIAPTIAQLNAYAESLNFELQTLNFKLHDSGYRRYNGRNYECILDIGQVGPNYQPGHAHADTFNFVLNVKNKPIIVDTGISTYDTGETRLKERGTAAHNTVTIMDKNSSEVWSSFRVANRAEVQIMEDKPDNVVASHNGYRSVGTKHRREWLFDKDSVTIFDKIIGQQKSGTAHFHLAPGILPDQTKTGFKIDNAIIYFKGTQRLELIKAQLPCGYNVFSDHYKIEVSFNNELQTSISII